MGKRGGREWDRMEMKVWQGREAELLLFLLLVVVEVVVCMQLLGLTFCTVTSASSFKRGVTYLACCFVFLLFSFVFFSL